MKTTSLIVFTALAVAALTSRGVAQTIVPLGTAASYGVLASSTATSTGLTVINGDLGVSPGFTATGFPPGVVNGVIHAGDSAASQAQLDATSAYGLITGQTATTSGVAAFSNTTLSPGVYNAAASLSLTGIITLDGNAGANPVFVFQIGSTLLTGIGSQIVLINGARAENIFWQVGTSATLAGSSAFAGTILAATSISVDTGVTIDGRLLALDGAVTLASDTISVPVAAIPEPADTVLLVAGAFGLVVVARKRRWWCVRA